MPPVTRAVLPFRENWERTGAVGFGCAARVGVAIFGFYWGKWEIWVVCVGKGLDGMKERGEVLGECRVLIVDVHARTGRR